MRWYIGKDGVHEGPFEEDEIRARPLDQLRSMHVMAEGTETWMPIEHSKFASLVEGAPRLVVEAEPLPRPPEPQPMPRLFDGPTLKGKPIAIILAALAALFVVSVGPGIWNTLMEWKCDEVRREARAAVNEGGLLAGLPFVRDVQTYCKDSADRTRATPTTPSPAPQPIDQPGSFRSGVKVIGSDVEPGVYRTREAAPGCYWARLSGFSGQLGHIIANGNESGPVVISIGTSDKGFDSRNCGLWTRDLSSITSNPNAPFEDGHFIVGTDIAPGMWRNDAPEGCYWARLRGFSGTLGDTIANANFKDTVTIASSDKGFVSRRCGTWRKTD